MAEELRSGDPLFAFDADLVVRAWNRAAEELTGVSAGEAVGRRCWEILGGTDNEGSLVCHAGCSYARMAREGHLVPCHEILVRGPAGRRRVSVSTIVVRDRGERLFLHVLQARRKQPSRHSRIELTARQLEVLQLIADGAPAKVIALRLGLTELTVRNHIRAVLLALDAHSQLEAVATARRVGVLDL